MSFLKLQGLLSSTSSKADPPPPFEFTVPETAGARALKECLHIKASPIDVDAAKSDLAVEAERENAAKREAEFDKIFADISTKNSNVSQTTAASEKSNITPVQKDTAVSLVGLVQSKTTSLVSTSRMIGVIMLLVIILNYYYIKRGAGAGAGKL